MVKSAIRTGDYSNLDYDSRLVCIRLFKNQGWQLPEALVAPYGTPVVEPVIKEELTLWKGIQLCLKYPEVRNSPNSRRHKQCFVNIVEKWGRDFPISKIWIPKIKEYQIDRLNDGAAPATINREKTSLSKMFQVLLELQLVDINPARLVRKLSEKTGQRQVYISYSDYLKIAELLPVWFRSAVSVAFYTGMRKGEILNLTRDRVNLQRRMIYLGPDDVKEKDWKRVPIHRELVPVFEDVMKVQALNTNMIFLRDGKPIVMMEQIRTLWHRAVKEAGLTNPTPRFHDLRHTWKTNARRSEIDVELREAIMGHGDRALSVRDRYGRISDEELLRAIDKLTFDHGETEVWVASQKGNPA